MISATPVAGDWRRMSGSDFAVFLDITVYIDGHSPTDSLCHKLLIYLRGATGVTCYAQSTIGLLSANLEVMIRARQLLIRSPWTRSREQALDL